MSNIVDDLRRDEIQTKLRELPAADWIQDMRDYFRRTGTYRAADLRRLLSDPNRGVEVGPNANRSEFMAQFHH
jgi:hypothetical protein